MAQFLFTNSNHESNKNSFVLFYFTWIWVFPIIILSINLLAERSCVRREVVVVVDEVENAAVAWRLGEDTWLLDVNAIVLACFKGFLE